MEDIRRKCNLLVDLSKFTSNKNILSKSCSHWLQTNLYPNLFLFHGWFPLYIDHIISFFPPTGSQRRDLVGVTIHMCHHVQRM